MAGEWNEKQVFLQALALPEGERPAFLDRTCPDEESRGRIEALLRHHAETTAASTGGTRSDIGSKPPIPDRIDEFKILRVLGEGGMGVVYLAEDTVLGRKVALKVLARHLLGSEAAIGRFRDEARAAAALKHPGVVPVYTFRQDGQDRYLICEYVDGPTLREFIAQEKSRRAGDPGTRNAREWHRQCAEIVASVAEALEACHRANLVHRDVKPSNILLDPQSGPRLTDFGIAKHLAPGANTYHTSLIGSYHYMSPEQAAASKAGVDHRSDIFSLGVILYEMLTTQRPFDGPDLQRVLHAVTSEEPRRLGAIEPRISADLETVCHKALEKDPAHRYQSAAVFAAELRNVIAGRPILARPPGLARKARRWAGAHRAAVLAATVVILGATVLGLGGLTVSMRNARLAWFSVESDEPGCTVLIQPIDAATLEVSPTPTRLGTAPLHHEGVEPGVYRVTVVASDPDVFAEFNAVLLRPGRERATVLRTSRAPKWTGVGGGPAHFGRLMPTSQATADGMVLVEAGDYDVRRTGEAKRPPGLPKLTLPAFYIDKTEVSNRRYKEFVDATGHRAPPLWEDGLDDEILDRPVVGVSLEDAEAYARWRGKRLPTSLEWEAAARGKEGHVYPWGNEPPEGRIEYDATPKDIEDAVSVVDALRSRAAYRRRMKDVAEPPSSRSALGLSNTFGNAGELTGSILRAPGSGEYALMMKGRDWSFPPGSCTLRTDFTLALYSLHEDRVGFRCARSVRAIDSD